MSCSKSRCVYGLAILTLAASAAKADLTPKQYPHEGDLYYDGARFADSVFFSHAPYGNYKTNTLVSDPALELDINMDRAYFTECTSWSDMPKFFDDCTTAGTLEEESASSFGVGTYDLRLLRQGQAYTAEWHFSGGSGANANISMSWQETWKAICPFEYPWCLESTGLGTGAGGRFFSGQWIYGATFYQRWNY